MFPVLTSTPSRPILAATTSVDASAARDSTSSISALRRVPSIVPGRKVFQYRVGEGGELVVGQSKGIHGSLGYPGGPLGPFVQKLLENYR